MKENSKINQDRILNYIKTRRNRDGGYTFFGMKPSGGFDTYFAIKIYELFGLLPPDKDKVADFLLNCSKKVR